MWLERHHPVFRDYLESAAKLRLRSQNGTTASLPKDADLQTLFDHLDPTRRRLTTLTALGAGRTRSIRDGALDMLLSLYKSRKPHDSR